jgi:hypothetical protein
LDKGLRILFISPGKFLSRTVYGVNMDLSRYEPSICSFPSVSGEGSDGGTNGISFQHVCEAQFESIDSIKE